MIQQLINNYLRPNREKITDILFDIELFYSYMQQCQIHDDAWYFQNVFTRKYWKYFGNYKWLTPQKQNYLDQGILSIVLFRCFQHLEKTNMFSTVEIHEISSSVKQLHSQNILTIRLKEMVSKVAIHIENDEENYEGDLHKSISWTLKNIILMNDIKNTNQR